MNTDWIVPHWPVPAQVHAVCTTRRGGVSHAPYDSMNLGDHVGDDVVNVGKNRAQLHKAIQATPVFLQQVHGVKVIQHGVQAIQFNQAGQPGEATPHGSQADACITQRAGVACTIMVADCLPVLFANKAGNVVGAAHAGWRGLAGLNGLGVLETSFRQYETLALAGIACIDTKSIAKASPGKDSLKVSLKVSMANEMLVWLGPCIGPQKFEVGGEVRDAFVLHDPSAQSMFAPLGHGKWLADLAGLARLRLRALGITQIYGNDGSRAWCTASNPSRFFSHRRDAQVLGGSGRMAACIWLG